MSNSNKKFLVDFLFSSLPKIVGKVKGVILIPVVTKVLGQEAFGIWTNFTIGLTLVASVASLSLGAATNQFLVDTSENQLREEYSAIMVVSTLSSAVIGVLLILFRDPLATVAFGSDTRSYLVILLAGALVFSLFTRQSVQFYRSQRRMDVFAGVQSTRSIGEIAAVTLAALTFESIIGIVSAYLVFHICFSLIVGILIFRDFGIGYPDFERIDQYVRFGIPLVVTGMMYWIVNVSDRYLITYFHDVNVTGGYAVVYATASVLGIFSLAIGTVLFPDLSSLRKNNESQEYRERLSNILKYFLVISVPATIGLIVIADPLLLLLSSTSISGYTDLMYILAPAMLAYGMFNILIQAILSDGRSRSSAIIWGAIAVLNFGANLVLVPEYAAIGASITTLGSFLVGLGIVILWKRKDIVISFGDVGKIAVASILMGAIVSLAQSVIPLPGPVILPLLVGIGVVVYASLGFVSGFLTSDDIMSAVDTIRG